MIHSLTSTTRLNVITKRAMINAPEGMIAKLHALPTYPVLEGLSIAEDYSFVAEDEAYPVNTAVLKYGPCCLHKQFWNGFIQC